MKAGAASSGSCGCATMATVAVHVVLDVPMPRERLSLGASAKTLLSRYRMSTLHAVVGVAR
jgi:hypothetical protein